MKGMRAAKKERLLLAHLLGSRERRADDGARAKQSNKAGESQSCLFLPSSNPSLTSPSPPRERGTSRPNADQRSKAVLLFWFEWGSGRKGSRWRNKGERRLGGEFSKLVRAFCSSLAEFPASPLFSFPPLSVSLARTRRLRARMTCPETAGRRRERPRPGGGRGWGEVQHSSMPTILLRAASRKKEKKPSLASLLLLLLPLGCRCACCAA